MSGEELTLEEDVRQANLIAAGEDGGAEGDEALETAEGEETEGEEGDPRVKEYELPDGTKVKGQDAALKHAQKLLQEKDIALAQSDAWRQGMLEGRQGAVPQAPVVQEDPAEWETKFYANPKAAIMEAREQIANSLRAEQAQKDADNQAWDIFTQENPDLAAFKEDVIAVLTKNTNEVALMANRDPKAARTYVANKTREKFQMWAEAKKPRKDLGQQKSVGAGSGQATGVTPKAPEKKPTTFAQEIAMLKEKRRGKTK